MLDAIDAANDDFIRTTRAAAHRRGCRSSGQRLYDNDEVYKGTYTGPYCVHCEEFKVPGELIQPGNLCPIHHRPVEMLSEDNYFFRLSAYADRLLAAYRDGTLKVEPESARNEVLRFVESGLQDIVDEPLDVRLGHHRALGPSHVIYVWIDALLNYWTAVEGSEEYWPADIHLVGKDILRFHAVIWPAMLMAAGLPLPKQGVRQRLAARRRREDEQDQADRHPAAADHRSFRQSTPTATTSCARSRSARTARSRGSRWRRATSQRARRSARQPREPR